MPDRSGAERLKIWDPLLRGFHWLLAATVITSILLGHFGPNVMTLHFYAGYTVIGLLAFRLIWGLVGPRPARFATFVKGPGAVLRYAQELPERRPSDWPGHSPIGALSVIALLAALMVQVATGLISDPEDYINTGPFAESVPHETATDAVGWHFIGSWVVIGLVALHLAAIAFYRLWKREDLIRPMLTGWKWVRPRD